MISWILEKQLNLNHALLFIWGLSDAAKLIPVASGVLLNDPSTQSSLSISFDFQIEPSYEVLRVAEPFTIIRFKILQDLSAQIGEFPSSFELGMSACLMCMNASHALLRTQIRIVLMLWNVDIVIAQFCMITNCASYHSRLSIGWNW